MVLARHCDQLAGDFVALQSFVQKLRLPLQGFVLFFGVKNQERRRATGNAIHWRRNGFPALRRITTAKARFVIAQLVAQFVGLRVAQIKRRTAGGNDATKNFR